MGKRDMEIPYEHEQALKALLGERHATLENYALIQYRRAAEMLERANMPPLSTRDMFWLAMLAMREGRWANRQEGRLSKRREWENKNGFLEPNDKCYVQKGVHWYPGVFEGWVEGAGTMFVRINGVKREKVRCSRVLPTSANVRLRDNYENAILTPRRRKKVG